MDDDPADGECTHDICKVGSHIKHVLQSSRIQDELIISMPLCRQGLIQIVVNVGSVLTARQVEAVKRVDAHDPQERACVDPPKPPTKPVLRQSDFVGSNVGGLPVKALQPVPQLVVCSVDFGHTERQYRAKQLEASALSDDQFYGGFVECRAKRRA